MGILHFIRIKVSQGLPGKPSPEDIHTDKHDLLAIHFIGKTETVKGGVNHIYTNEAKNNFSYRQNKQYLIEQVPLYSEFDTLYISDKNVKHYATDLYCKDKECSGYRDVIIIDFERKSN